MGGSLPYFSDVVCTLSVKLLQVRCGSQEAKGQARDTETMVRNLYAAFERGNGSCAVRSAHQLD